MSWHDKHITQEGLTGLYIGWDETGTDVIKSSLDRGEVVRAMDDYATLLDEEREKLAEYTDTEEEATMATNEPTETLEELIERLTNYSVGLSPEDASTDWGDGYVTGVNDTLDSVVELLMRLDNSQRQDRAGQNAQRRAKQTHNEFMRTLPAPIDLTGGSIYTDEELEEAIR